MADYSEAVRLDPKYALAFNNRGNIYSEKAISIEPSQITAKPSDSIPSTLSPSAIEEGRN